MDQISQMTPEMSIMRFRSLIWMHNVVATSFNVSTKDEIGNEPFADMSDMVCYGLIWNTTDKYRNYTV